MPRFFVTPAALDADTVCLSGEDARHISLSLRMAVGDTLTLSDGEGREAVCRLDTLSPDAVTATVLSRHTGVGEMPISVILYQALPKGDKLETIVQKATELGAAAVYPFESSRCITRVRAERTARQTARLQRIADEAAGQCGRARLLRVSEPGSFAAALADARGRCDAVLFCYEDERARTLRGALEELYTRGIRTLGLFVGAEGGFSPEEAAAAREAGFLSVGLGPRILRCETAPLCALSCISFVFEL